MTEAFGRAEASESRVVYGAGVAGGFGGSGVGSDDCRDLLLESIAKFFREVCGDEFEWDIGVPWCLSAG